MLSMSLKGEVIIMDNSTLANIIDFSFPPDILKSVKHLSGRFEHFGESY